jgi:hypothetical protein
MPEARCFEFHSKKCVHVVNVVHVMNPCSHPVDSHLMKEAISGHQ